MLQPAAFFTSMPEYKRVRLMDDGQVDADSSFLSLTSSLASHLATRTADRNDMLWSASSHEFALPADKYKINGLI